MDSYKDKDKVTRRGLLSYIGGLGFLAMAYPFVGLSKGRDKVVEAFESTLLSCERSSGLVWYDDFEDARISIYNKYNASPSNWTITRAVKMDGNEGDVLEYDTAVNGDAFLTMPSYMDLAQNINIEAEIKFLDFGSWGAGIGGVVARFCETISKPPACQTAWIAKADGYLQLYTDINPTLFNISPPDGSLIISTGVWYKLRLFLAGQSIALGRKNTISGGSYNFGWGTPYIDRGLPQPRADKTMASSKIPPLVGHIGFHCWRARMQVGKIKATKCLIIYFVRRDQNWVPGCIVNIYDSEGRRKISSTKTGFPDQVLPVLNNYTILSDDMFPIIDGIVEVIDEKGATIVYQSFSQIWGGDTFYIK